MRNVFVLLTGKKIVRSPVNQDIIHFVSLEVCGGWRMLGRALGVKGTFINNIAEEVRSEGPQDLSQYEECFRVLRRWYEQSGGKATIRMLLTAITNCGEVDIAEKLCKELIKGYDAQ